MNKIFLIISREYWSRVKKKSFILMSILGPLLLAAVMILPIWLATRDKTESMVLVIDETALLKDSLKSSNNVKFFYTNLKLQAAQDSLFKSKFDGILYLPAALIGKGAQPLLYFKEDFSMLSEEYINNEVEDKVYEYQLKANNIDLNIIKNAKKKIDLQTKKLDKNGNAVSSTREIKMAMSYVFSMLIYFFVFMYGVQVMRGVMEEKTSRIVEVIISSVKPFQLMMGKILGIALVGITQFVLWIIFTSFFTFIVQTTMLSKILKSVDAKKDAVEQVYKKGSSAKVDQLSQAAKNPMANKDVMSYFKSISDINIIEVVATFLIYFILGYLLYASLFAAVGAAVDSETETQQFMMPISIPLIAGIISLSAILNNSNSTFSVIMSMIPFTSPVCMMGRMPFGVPMVQVMISVVLLFATFLLMTWLAGKIYRTGILMYGKKASWKEFAKWIMYK
jgi:ABC-2 type transport system permease protein